ncbi:hypothetical protein ebA1746 [Aromatoleum aromaticum EbN1]|uniref:Uncharacterized protein n=1 Tax=Aromatoleum aromaticum (strain DSM 19018 / LMG 30748 / EbN1) TaxID=76114 RepID=Q5P6J3_AROAE|nr:hypothetical protein ebA1746 [Aromatoleum aromaticum EbN1]
MGQKDLGAAPDGVAVVDHHHPDSGQIHDVNPRWFVLAALPPGRHVRHPQASELDRLEVFLAGSALGAGPVRRKVFPAGARRDTFGGQSYGFVIDETADQAHPGAVLHVGHLAACSARIGCKIRRILPHFPCRARPAGVPHSR